MIRFRQSRPPGEKKLNVDDFVKKPNFGVALSACGGLSLRRTKSTPHDTRFARLELGLFTKSSQRVTFYEFIKESPARI
jgi:hypothetical protein